jgi:hypothetical protein
MAGPVACSGARNALTVQNYTSARAARRGTRHFRTARSVSFRGMVPAERGAAVSVMEWIWTGAALWLGVSIPLSLLLGRVIRVRDAQVVMPQTASSDRGSAPVSA